MSVDYERCVVAGLLVAEGLPEQAVDVWLDGAKETRALASCMSTVHSVFTPRRERRAYMALLGGDTGQGKTVGAVAALGEAMVRARMFSASGQLQVDRPVREAAEAIITPDRVRRVLAMDWDTYQANERLQPGVCARQVREAYEQEQGWNFAQLPLTFSWWDCPSRVDAPVYGEEAQREREWAKSCDVLVLDDLSAEFSEGSRWRGVVDDIVNARCAASFVTVLTTNLDKARFLERYRARIGDRIRGAGGTVLFLTGPSMRGAP